MPSKMLVLPDTNTNTIIGAALDSYYHNYGQKFSRDEIFAIKPALQNYN